MLTEIAESPEEFLETVVEEAVADAAESISRRLIRFLFGCFVRKKIKFN